MTWVKICGITDEAARDAAIEGGADAVGFVLAAGSPRSISIERATALMRGVPILRFIVTVDLTPSQALHAAQVTAADGIQNHGRHATAVAAAAIDAGYSSLHPVRVTAQGPDIDVGSIPGASLPLFDTASAFVHGGTGVAFDWHVLESPGRPFVLAGGLGVDNVAEAIRVLCPFGVDASSRLETEPGSKDPGTIAAFVREAKGT
ncbi:MAG: phosphoribosylanthranilate isomerase [Acidimicrobiia bacterium]